MALCKKVIDALRSPEVSQVIPFIPWTWGCLNRAPAEGSGNEVGAAVSNG